MTDQVKLTEAVPPGRPSVAVTTVLLLAWAFADTVPVISPVELIERPAGRPVGPNAIALPSGSLAWICSETLLPAAVLWPPGFVTTGARFVVVARTLTPLAVANQTFPAWSSAIAMTMSQTSPLFCVVNVCHWPTLLSRATPLRDANQTSPLFVIRMSVTRGCGSCGALKML